MEVRLECDCGRPVSGTADGGLSEATFIECADCDAVWTVTVTNIRDGDTNQRGG